jgi:hypothetical protein
MAIDLWHALIPDRPGIDHMACGKSDNCTAGRARRPIPRWPASTLLEFGHEHFSVQLEQ